MEKNIKIHEKIDTAFVSKLYDDRKKYSREKALTAFGRPMYIISTLSSLPLLYQNAATVSNKKQFKLGRISALVV